MAHDATPNRIERRKQDFRDRITRAALTLFEEQGVAATSIAAIIQQADIAHKTFFNHFPTKDHLLQHIACSFGDKAHAAFLAGLREHSDPRKRIAYCLMSVARALEGVNAHYKGLLNLYLISGAGDPTLQQRQKAQFSAVIGQVMRDAKAAKQLRPSFRPETLTEVTVGLCVATLLNWSLEDDYPIVARMKEQVRFINDSLFVDTH